MELTWARIGHAQNTLYGSGINSRYCDRIFRHIRRIRSGAAPHAVTFRDRVGRIRQFLIASGQIQMAASARIRRKIEQPEKSGMLT